MGSPFGASTDYLAICGAVTLSYLSLKLGLNIFSGLKCFLFGSGINLRKFGEWAVVTGSTDGIGKAYAEELAKAGINIVLISRSPEKLADVAAEIESKFKVKTKTVAVDFTLTDDIYDKIKKEIEGLEIGTLVNNVGMSYSHPMYLAELPSDKMIADLININIFPVTLMTRLVLPSMVERKRGAIINISSASGAIPTPLLSVYSATKAYVDVFSRSLEMEYQSKGIVVQCVLPYFVSTKLSKIRKANLMVPTPTSYVKSALKAVGQTERTFGCLPHAVQGFVVTKLMPTWLYRMIVLKEMTATRSKAIKRAQKAQ